MKRSILAAILLAVAVGGWVASRVINDTGPVFDLGVAPAAGPSQTPQVRVRTQVAEERTSELVLFGRTEAVRVVNIKAETTGRVVKQVVRKGGVVKKGDVIVHLAMDDRKARLTEAKASVAHYLMAYKADQKLSRKEYRSKVKLAESRALLEKSRAQLRRVHLDIERTAIRAPFAGIVDRLPVEIGDYIAVGVTVATVVDLDPILVVGEVAERDIDKVIVGDIAGVRMASGRVTAGTIRYISKTGSPRTRTFRVEVAVDNPGGGLAEGLTAELRLPTGQVLAHRVSPAVLTLSDEGVVGVKTVDADNLVAFHPVKMIADTPEGIWLGGLPRRVTLITVGQEFVRPGQRVDAVHEDGGAPAEPMAPGRPEQAEPVAPAPGGEGGGNPS